MESLEKVNVQEAQTLISLSEKVFGFCFRKYFPHQIGNFNLVYGSYEENMGFILQNKDDLYSGNKNYFIEDFSEKKINYYKNCVDYFTLYDGEKIIGSIIGNMTDWATYYFRFGMIKKEYQRLGLQAAIEEHLTQILIENNISKVEVDVVISNKPQIGTFLKKEYFIVGTFNSEIYGSTIKLCRILNENRENKFKEIFCYNNHSKKRSEANN